MGKVVAWERKCPLYKGRRIDLEVRVERHEGTERFDRDLRRVESFRELSISGSGGQNYDEILMEFAGDELIARVVEIWKRWHLGGMHAGTKLQDALLEKAVSDGRLSKSYDFADRSSFLDMAVRVGLLKQQWRPARTSELETANAKVEAAFKAMQTLAARVRECKHDSYPRRKPNELEMARFEKLTRKLHPGHERRVAKDPATVWGVLLEDAEAFYKNATETRDEIRSRGFPYKYGFEWLVDPLPQEVEEELKRLLIAIDESASSGDDVAEDSHWIAADGQRWNLDSIERSTRGGVECAIFRCGASEYIAFGDRELAGEAAANYWREMAKDDPKEFACIVGEEHMIRWCLGQPSGPGSTKVTSIEAWFKLFESAPHEELARYDGKEVVIQEVSASVREEFGILRVAYREN